MDRTKSTSRTSCLASSGSITNAIKIVGMGDKTERVLANSEDKKKKFFYDSKEDDLVPYVYKG